MLISGTRPGFANRPFGARAAFCLLTVILGFAACRNGDEFDTVFARDAAAERPNDHPYCLDLLSSRSDILLGEPVKLIVSLTNCSSETLTPRDLLAPEFGLLAVWVQRPGGTEEALYGPAIRRDGRGKQAIELAPGESINAEIPIYYGRDGWVLNREGVYSVRAEYPIGKNYIQSQSVELRVARGGNADQLAAAQAFMQPHASRFYFLTGGDEQGEHELEQIVDAYPNTLWASYSRLAIELNRILSGDSASRKASCQQFYNDSSGALASIPDIVTASKGYQILVECLRNAGRHDDAESTKAKFYTQFPEALDSHAQWISDMTIGDSS